MSSSRRRVVAVVGGLTVAALFWAAGVQAGTASCQKDLALIDAGAPGPLSCVSQGTPTILVGKSTTLALRTMSVALTAVRTASRYTLAVRGQAPGAVKAKGVFIVLTITVTNDTHAAHVFNAQSQVVLEINDNPNAPIEFVDRRLGFGALLAGPTIHPRLSVTGDLLFDVPKSALRTFPAKSGLALVNFGQNTSSGLVSQLGVFDMAGAA
jgi:hypothetical protein